MVRGLGRWSVVAGAVAIADRTNVVVVVVVWRKVIYGDGDGTIGGTGHGWKEIF